MFSSLPSASKIYVGNTAKSRVKTSVSGKRRRKKPNSHDKNGTHLDYEVKNKETETLVSSAQCSKSTDLYSVVQNEEIDFDHTSSDNETSFYEYNSEIKSVEELIGNSEETNACSNDSEYKFDNVKHNDSNSGYCDDIFEKHEGIEEYPLQDNQKNFKTTVSEDDNVNDFSANILNANTNNEKEINRDLQSSAVALSNVNSCLIIDSDVELKVPYNGHNVETELTVAHEKGNQQIKNLQSIPSQKECSENEKQRLHKDYDDNCKDKDLNDVSEENSEEISPRSDCCESANIFDERDLTITEDSDTVDNNYFSNSKQDSTEDEEERPVNKTRSCSPETSEISCTESVKFDSQNIIPFNKSKDVAVSTESKSHLDAKIQSSINASTVNDSIGSVITNQKAEQSTFISHNCLEINEGKHRSLSRSLSFPCLKSFRPMNSLLYDEKLSSPHLPSHVNALSNSSENEKLISCCTNCKTLVEQNDINKCDGEKLDDDIVISKHSMSSFVLPLDMKKARLRSYVVGNIGATGSLIGANELLRIFPEKMVTFFIGTWNMNGQDPPSNIDDFLLPLSISSMPDIYVIGIQECMQSRSEWEVLMQTTLGPSHVLFTSTSLGVLHLSIFLRRDLIWFCSEPEEANVTTRPGSMVKTKGAVAIGFTLFGTSFLFINSHLTAHEKNLKERVCDYEKICSSLNLPKTIPLKFHYRSKDVTSRFDNVFWNGDLNFRVVQDRSSVLSFVEEKISRSVKSCNVLLKHDQLQKAMNDGVVFHGFNEGPIDFIPSYKFDVGTSTFDSAKQRVPSYTDRILYRSKNKDSINCVHYNAVSEISTSDHKPVFAIFEVVIKPGRDNIPLAAGLFKRDVYLEANRRRAMALQITHNFEQSTICSVM